MSLQRWTLCYQEPSSPEPVPHTSFTLAVTKKLLPSGYVAYYFLPSPTHGYLSIPSSLPLLKCWECPFMDLVTSPFFGNCAMISITKCSLFAFSKKVLDFLKWIPPYHCFVEQKLQGKYFLGKYVYTSMGKIWTFANAFNLCSLSSNWVNHQTTKPLFNLILKNKAHSSFPNSTIQPPNHSGNCRWSRSRIRWGGIISVNHQTTKP